jgi:hypothetical protein
MPNFTAVAAVRLVPVIVTEVPPVFSPIFGNTEPTVGNATYVNRSAEVVALVPPAVVTVTSTVLDPGGLVAVIWVALETENEAAAAEPNFTAVAAVKLVPVIITGVPPAPDPPFGVMPVTVAARGLGPLNVSALARLMPSVPLFPPATRTLPSLSNVEVKCNRAVAIDPASDHVPVPAT